MDDFFQFERDEYVQILHGDCREVLKTLPEKYFQTVVTSPPYFNLRSYLPDDHPDKHLELGQETSPEAFAQALVEVFREVRRVLKDDGTVFINLGDSFSSKTAAGIKPKDQLLVPHTVALALRVDGWYLRSTVIWNKLDAMPEPVKDRPSNSHEYLFMLSKQAHYHYDADAVREPYASRYSLDAIDKAGGIIGGERPDGNNFSKQKRHEDGIHTPSTRADRAKLLNPKGRNRRSVWSLSTNGHYRGAHFAVMPPALIEPCILAGCPEGGHVLDPFGGSGTVGLVAKRLNRKATLIELNANYIPLIEERIRKG